MDEGSWFQSVRTSREIGWGWRAVLDLGPRDLSFLTEPCLESSMAVLYLEIVELPRICEVV